MSRTEELIEKILNGEPVDIVPKSRAEAYLKNCCNRCGCEGLPEPISRLDALLYRLAEELEGGLNEAEWKSVLDGTIRSIIIPEGITQIRRYMFYYGKLSETLIIPNTVVKIEDYAFALNYNVNPLILGSSLSEIGAYSFYYLTHIEELTLPSSITKINSRAFAVCSGLTTVRFEGTPTSIESDVFYGSTMITNIYVPWNEDEVSGAPWGATNATIIYNYTGD